MNVQELKKLINEIPAEYNDTQVTMVYYGKNGKTYALPIEELQFYVDDMTDGTEKPRYVDMVVTEKLEDEYVHIKLA